MARYHIYGEIKTDLLRIEKLVLDADDGYAEPRWQEIKEDIRKLADSCDHIRAERKQRDREEATERRRANRGH